METMAHARPAVRTDIDYAGFWRRVLAYLIDAALLSAVGSALFVGAVLLDAGSLTALVNASWISALLGWAYFSLFESSPARGTLGKIALGLFVGDAHGDPITFMRASVRYWLKSLSSLFLMLGWLMAAFTPRKQALHDLLAGTLVLRKVTRLVIGEEPPTEPGDYWDGTRWVANVTPPLSLENR